jgi:hypothetical protein
MRAAVAAAVAAAAVGVGCYGGPDAIPDINAAWRGRSRAAIEARWGKPQAEVAAGAGAALTWSFTRTGVSLPSGSASLKLEPGAFDFEAEWSPGKVWTSTTSVVAVVDAAGVIQDVQGPSLRRGPPRGLNLRWGTIFGVHAGMGRLDDTGTALPSGGMYLGGMLGPRLGLAGAFSMVFGKDDAGGAVGFAWGINAHYWPAARLAVRAGPALVLDLDPGFEDAAVGPGLNGGASYALVRAGSFVLDLRLDLTAAPEAAFGALGLGVNVN